MRLYYSVVEIVILYCVRGYPHYSHWLIRIIAKSIIYCNLPLGQFNIHSLLCTMRERADKVLWRVRYHLRLCTVNNFSTTTMTVTMNNNIIININNKTKVYLVRRDKQACLCEFIFSKLIKKSCHYFKINEYAKKKIHIHLEILESSRSDFGAEIVNFQGLRLIK